MPVETGFYSQMQAPDILGNVQKGLNMREMIDQRAAQKQQAASDQAFKTAVSQNMGEDGMVNAQGMSQLAGINPEKTMALRQNQSSIRQSEGQNKSMDLKQAMEQMGAIGQVLGPANDDPSWSAGRAKLQSIGLDVSDIPESYDPSAQKFIIGKSLSVIERGNQQMEQQQAQQSEEWKRLNYGQRDRQIEATQGARQDQREYKREQEETKKRESLKVPGLGLAQTPTDAKKLKESVEMKSKFDRQIGELIDLRKDKGVEYFDREAVGRGKQLSKDLLLTYKNLAKLGVLSAADEKIINAIIPSDPLGQDWMPGQDSILHQLESFKADLDEDYKTTIKTRLRSPDEAISKMNQQKSAPPPPITTPEEDQQAFAWAESNPSDPRAQAILQSMGGR